MPRAICVVCGGEYVAKVPKGGDGSLWVPYAHRIAGEICTGSYREADLIDANNEEISTP